MSDEKDIVREQQKRQEELIALKRRKQAVESGEEIIPEVSKKYELTAVGKIKNFWYYSRFTIAFLLIIAVILAVGITQCSTRIDYDCTVVVYFKRYLAPEMIENLGRIAEVYCPDFNGDGEVHVLMMDCSMADDENSLATGQVKSTRLLSQFANEEAIVYIVDKDGLEALDTVANGVFVDDSLGLPEYEGKAFSLSGTVFDAAFDYVSEDYSSQFEYYLIRRVVDGTAIGTKKGVDKYSSLGNELIGNIIADPYLTNGMTPELTGPVAAGE